MEKITTAKLKKSKSFVEIQITVINRKGEGAFIFIREYNSFSELLNELNDYDPEEHSLDWRKFGMTIEVLEGFLTQNEINILENNDIEVKYKF